MVDVLVVLACPTPPQLKMGCSLDTRQTAQKTAENRTRRHNARSVHFGQHNAPRAACSFSCAVCSTTHVPNSSSNRSRNMSSSRRYSSSSNSGRVLHARGRSWTMKMMARHVGLWRRVPDPRHSWLIVVVVSCLASHVRAEDVECMYERRVEDYMDDPNDTYDNEYGVCTTVASSGQTKTYYLTEPGMPHRDRTPD